MVEIVRIKDIDDKRRAGESFKFWTKIDNGRTDNYQAAMWLLGKDINDYQLFKNGVEVTPSSPSMNVIERELALAGNEN